MNIYVGVDVGSVSTNIVALDTSGNVLFERYLRTNGQPIVTVKEGFLELSRECEKKGWEVCGVGTTGSGRQLAGQLVGADVVKNEISAHAVATVHFYPDVRTIFEIGGQDSKIIIIRDGMVTDFAMNTVCAAGTGSFLDHQAERLGVPISQFGDLALQSGKKVRIAGRCTVFAESDMISKQQYGFSKPEIIRGLCEALVRNYMNNLSRGKKLEPRFVFQGGVAANKGIVKAFEEEVAHEITVPRHSGVMGAIGSAILAKEQIERTGKKTKFAGFSLSQVDFKPTSIICNGCANSCEVIRIYTDGKITATWGDKCGKWTNALEIN